MCLFLFRFQALPAAEFSPPDHSYPKQNQEGYDNLIKRDKRNSNNVGTIY